MANTYLEPSDLSAYVPNTGNTTIGGIKTFTSAPVFPVGFVVGPAVPRIAYPTTPDTLFINSTTDALSVSAPNWISGGVLVAIGQIYSNATLDN